LISLMLASGKTPTEVLELFLTHSRAIFHRPFIRRLPLVDIAIDAFRPMYDNRYLLQVAEDTFPNDMRLGDLGLKVLITAFDLNGKLDGLRSWKPKFFHNVDIKNNDNNERVVDVAMRTAAAPTYFPNYQRYVDGGVVVNNPSIPALLQALYKPEDAREDKRSWVPTMDQISLFSVGTGKFEKFIEGQNQRWGFLKWAFLFPDISVSTQTGMTAFQSELLLGDRAFRLNALLK
jgi:patatin-like phospholipase/acyl hydrolase